MGGGVHPAEWIFPAVGGSHALYNAGAQAVGQTDFKLNAPDTPNADAIETRRDQRGEDVKLQAANEEAERARIAALPMTPQQELESRKRAGVAASQLLSGGKRKASQTLTTAGNTLAGVV